MTHSVLDVCEQDDEARASGVPGLATGRLVTQEAAAECKSQPHAA
jgi:hypothetical protein